MSLAEFTVGSPSQSSRRKSLKEQPGSPAVAAWAAASATVKLGASGLGSTLCAPVLTAKGLSYSWVWPDAPLCLSPTHPPVLAPAPEALVPQSFL